MIKIYMACQIILTCKMPSNTPIMIDKARLSQVQTTVQLTTQSADQIKKNSLRSNLTN